MIIALPTRSERTIQADDGRELAATVMTGVTGDVAVVAGGMAIRRGFYDAFAGWLASRGPTVVTFDYRDTGGSRVGDLRASTSRLAEWGRYDIEGVLRYAASRTNGRLLFVGHSAGGQLLGLAPSAGRIDRIATVGANTGYWRNAAIPERYRLWGLWHLVFPAAVRTVGHLPLRRLGMGEDLPPGVARDWIRWCRHPDYLFGDRDLDTRPYATITAPMRAYHASDDPWATRHAVEDLHGRYPNATCDILTLRPDAGQAIGHVAFFRPRAGKAHWPGLAAWLQADTTPGPTVERDHSHTGTGRRA